MQCVCSTASAQQNNNAFPNGLAIMYVYDLENCPVNMTHKWVQTKAPPVQKQPHHQLTPGRFDPLLTTILAIWTIP